MLTELDASAVRRWCSIGAAALHAHRQEIDDLNVFPIPDGDTGTNMSLTLRSAAEAVDGDRSPGAGDVLRAMARGAVMGARGNSGVIVSQILRGIAESVDGAIEVDGQLLSRGLCRACDVAYEAVSEPVEGTMLSVARAAADAAASAGAELPDIVRAAARGAQDGLERTPEQLEALARAGVVDAGGRGLVVLLDALAAVVTGEEQSAGRPPRGRDRRALEQAREEGSDEFGYEVQYLLHAPEGSIDELRESLARLGDSVAVVGTGEGLFNVHVHVNDVGAAIEAGVEVGRPHRITVIRFSEQFASQASRTELAGTALVAVAPGEGGLADLLRSEGATVVDGGPMLSPSTTELLEAIVASGARQVVVLPNSTAIAGVAEMAAEQAREQGIVAAVVRTKSPVQALAAMAVHDESRRFDDDVIAMAETAAATRFAEITVAVRDAITYAGRCSAGDVLGLIDGEVVEIGGGIAESAIKLVDRLIAVGGELVTVLVGDDGGGAGGEAAAAAAALERHVHREHPEVEISTFDGGQPHYPLLIGVE